MNRIGQFRTALWHLRKGGIEQLGTWRNRQGFRRGVYTAKNVVGFNGYWRGMRAANRSLSFVPYRYPQRQPRRSDVTVAVILDDFSFRAFSYEWNVVPLARKTWKEQLAKVDVDFLFVESAWNGNEGEWKYQLTGTGGPKADFLELVNHCNLLGIPTVFWNKEDPPHFDDFITAASHFNHVFTSDVRLIPAYMKVLGHSRVDVLSFAAQPAIHNPIRERSGFHSRDVAFAGMYFRDKYPERKVQMNLLLASAVEATQGLNLRFEIFSRFLNGRREYQFPAPFSDHVVGSLDYQQMLTAYRAYKVFLNVNTVVESESMCARRIFEISASGTPVITTRSAAVDLFFADDEVLVADSISQGRDQIHALTMNPELNDRVVHKAQRKIWSQHTYAHRAEQIVANCVPHLTREIARPKISALVSTFRPEQLEHVFSAAGSQLHVDLQLVLVTHGFEIDRQQFIALQDRYDVENVVTRNAAENISLGECLNMCIDAADGDVFSKMDDDDYYAPNYLADMANALSYSRADVVGKRAQYMYFRNSRATILRSPEHEHRFTNLVAGPTLTASSRVFRQFPFLKRGRGEDTNFLRDVADAGGSVYSTDRFNYCQIRNNVGHTWDLSDIELMTTGRISIFGEPFSHVSI